MGPVPYVQAQPLHYVGGKGNTLSTPYSFQITAAGGPSVASGSSVTVAATSTAPAITIGHNQLVRIVATGPVNIRFGIGLVTSTATDVYLPANAPEIFDMGRHSEQIMFYNPGSSTVTVFYSIVSRT